MSQEGFVEVIHTFDNKIQDEIHVMTNAPYIQPLAWLRNERYLAMEAKKENGNTQRNKTT